MIHIEKGFLPDDANSITINRLLFATRVKLKKHLIFKYLFALFYLKMVSSSSTSIGR